MKKKPMSDVELREMMATVKKLREEDLKRLNKWRAEQKKNKKKKIEENTLRTTLMHYYVAFGREQTIQLIEGAGLSIGNYEDFFQKLAWEFGYREANR